MSLAIFCGCTARFVSDLVGNTKDRFSDVCGSNYKHVSYYVTQPMILALCLEKILISLGIYQV